MPVFTRVVREMDFFFSFSWRDWLPTVIPGSIFAAGAMRNLPLTTLVSRYLFVVTWLVPYIYFFNLSNQITGIYEDKINKPDRPIPSGKVTVQGAQRRWIVTLSIFLGIGFYQSTLLPQILFCISITTFLCVTFWKPLAREELRCADHGNVGTAQRIVEGDGAHDVDERDSLAVLANKG